MSALVQIITRGQIGTISSYPPVVGIPTSVTCRTGTSAVGLPTSFSAATVDADSDTLSTELREGDIDVLLTSGTVDIVKGRQYLITPLAGADDDADPFVVTASSEMVAATEFSLRQAAPRGADADSLLSEWRVSTSISALQSATVGDGLVEFQATVAGKIIRWIEPFRVVERGGTYDLTGDLLARMSPYARAHRPDDDQDFSQVLEAAWVMHLSPALYGKGIRPERIASWQAINPAHVKAVEMLLADAYEQDAQVRTEKHSAFTLAFNTALDSMQFWVTADQDPTPPNSTGPTFLFSSSDISR